MGKQEIIEELARGKIVEEIIDNICKTNSVEMRDLAQDIYLSLLEKDEKRIQKLYDNQQLSFFIAKMVTNNYFSETSPFYTKYKKFSARSEELKNGF